MYEKKLKIVILSIMVVVIFILLFFILEKNKIVNLLIDENIGTNEKLKPLTNENLKTFYCSEKDWNIIENPDKDFGHDYYAKNGKVYFLNFFIEQPSYICELLSADYQTFEVLDFAYAKDENHVYYRYSELIEADPATFEIVLEGNLAKDKDNVYLSGQILPSLDSDSLEDLGYMYMRTKDGIFIRNANFDARKIEEADSKTFEVVNFSNSPSYMKSSYDAKDKNNYYKKGVIVELKN